MAKTKTAGKTNEAKKSKGEVVSLPAGKNRRANFARLATLRSNNALNAIRLIGNLSNVNDYEFTDKDVADIFSAIRTELAAAEARFAVSKVRASRKALQIAA